MNVKNESVVITGGTGFIGRHLATELREAGAKVHALGRADYDLRDREQIDVMLKQLTPAVVVHLASVEGGIGANESEPGRFFYENALMGIEMIDACRRAGVDKTVITG